MIIEVETGYEEASERAARTIAREILTGPKPVLGFPTGDTPKLTYEILVQYYEEGLVDFSGVTTFNLDEYYPISKDHPDSFTRYMKERLFDRINIPNENTHVPDGTVPENEIEPYCEEYERKIAEAGGLDLLVLGIGENGHIGFNEPGVDFGSRTRLVDLKRKTLEANFENPEEAPKRALTMGIKSIMRAQKILLLATGKRKATAVERALRGPVTDKWPGSVLQLHPDVRTILDEPAARELDDF
jgi:glucosamine-6-phosphate deaminase